MFEEFSFKTGAQTNGYFDFQDSGWLEYGGNDGESGENDMESGELENNRNFFQFSSVTPQSFLH
ncbi:hypothetical protein V7201_00415 [Bacillus sp. JJ1122]